MQYAELRWTIYIQSNKNKMQKKFIIYKECEITMKKYFDMFSFDFLNKKQNFKKLW